MPQQSRYSMFGPDQDHTGEDYYTIELWDLSWNTTSLVAYVYGTPERTADWYAITIMDALRQQEKEASA